MLLKDIYSIDCKINRILKKILKIDLDNNFFNTAVINSHRIGFNIRYKNKNVLGENELLGVAFFDKSTNLYNNTCFYEFELESYEQADVFASPYIFNDFNKIGAHIVSLGHTSSCKSKYERCFKSNNI